MQATVSGRFYSSVSGGRSYSERLGLNSTLDQSDAARERRPVEACREQGRDRVERWRRAGREAASVLSGVERWRAGASGPSRVSSVERAAILSSWVSFLS